MDISSTIKILREQQCLSIRKLAQLSGVAAAFISCIEKGTKNPSPATLAKLAPHLGVTYEYLMTAANYIKPDISPLAKEDSTSSSIILSLIQDLLKKRIITDENNIPEDVMNILISAIKLEINIQNKQLKK